MAKVKKKKSSSPSSAHPKVFNPPVLIAAGLMLVVLAIYLIRPPDLYAIHVWPMFAFSLPWILFCWGRKFKTVIARIGVVLGLWIGFMAIAGELPYQVFKRPLTERVDIPGTARIISMNCAGGEILAVARAMEWKVVIGPDATIVTRWPVVGDNEHVTQDWAIVTVMLPGGDAVTICSLRLSAVQLRMDYWKADCWRTWKTDYYRHLEEVQRVQQKMLETPGPVIIGGDFNCSDRKMITREFQGRVKNTYDEAGYGWPATFLNQYPLIRIDHILVSQEMETIQNYAEVVDESDHLLVICDVKL
jgi:hypothetical protein